VLGIDKALFSLHRRAVTLPRARRITDALAELAGSSRSLLDVGAGDGAIAAAVGERVGATRIAGVDVLVRPHTVIEVVPYDGRRLPFPDGAFEIVTISDVLHHCEAPSEVLAECLRVASRAVLVKDHFRFGAVSRALLLAMDVVGNAEAGVLVRGTYFSPAEWIEMVRRAEGRITSLRWPLRIHDAPMRFVTRDELQFAARIEHVRSQGFGA
jgi:ubiquinone/menaquinone biosynthesis C-methylase UbiE